MKRFNDQSPRSPDSAESRVFHCLATPIPHQMTARAWFCRWDETFSTRPLKIKATHQEALARLIPALLCGEQSAISVFHAEVERLSLEARNASVSVFRSIENDEYWHEVALQRFCARLPVAADLHAIKRRSQRFFSRLGRTRSVARHFAKISQLDSAVCIIMWHIEHSTVGGNSMIGVLAGDIKRDEARHVSISRQHALALGVSGDDYFELGEQVHTELTRLLAPLSDAFETIGVDVDRLFTRIRRKAQQ